MHRRLLQATVLIMAAHASSGATEPPDPTTGHTASAAAGDTVELTPAVSTATRMSAGRGVPASVSVVTREEIRAQTALSSDMAEILAKLVPGLGAPNQSQSIYGQSFRGRGLQVLIDGIPQSTSRNVARDLNTVHPDAVERVEVVRGASALYGDGATGGVINIITRSARPGEPAFSTRLGATTHALAPVDGGGLSLEQTFTHRVGAYDLHVAGSLGSNGGFFDAEGDRLSPDPHGQGGLADAITWSVLGKAGANLGAQRLELSVSRFDGRQYTEYAADPSVDTLPFGAAKSAAQYGLDLAEPQGSVNNQINAGYAHYDISGQQLRLQGFWRDYATRFTPFDGRAWYGDVIQSYVESRKEGGRLELELSSPSGAVSLPQNMELPALLLGIDAVHELTSQKVDLMDSTVYDASNGLRFVKTGTKYWVPPLDQWNLAGFAHLDWRVAGPLLLRAGLRREEVFIGVDDFTTITGASILGGDLRYGATLFNAGAVLSLGGSAELFGGYSQGFSLTDVGRTLRGAKEDSTVAALKPEPQLVDHYEAGIRAGSAILSVSLSAFMSESELGTTLTQAATVLRAPERIYGGELQVDARAGEAWRLGGSVTASEGEFQPTPTGPYKPLNGLRILPPKATAYIQHDFHGFVSNRLQALYSGKRNVFGPSTGYAEVPIEEFWLVDYVGSVQAGKGRVTLGVENLLNAQYYPVMSQIAWGGQNSNRTAGRGLTVSLGYSLSY